MDFQQKNILIDFSLSVYVLVGFFIIIYRSISKIVDKSDIFLIILNILLKIFLFTLISITIFSCFLFTILLKNSIFTPILLIFWPLCIFFSFLILILFCYLYYLNENTELSILNDKICQNPSLESLKFCFIFSISLLSIFIIINFFTDYFFMNLRLSYMEKMIGLYFGTLIIFSQIKITPFLVENLMYKPAQNLKKSINMEFEYGIFEKSLIKEELFNNSDELQSIIEKYKMTGNKLSKKEKLRMNELIAKQNLLVHRKNLTNQFVTKKAKLWIFFSKSIYILVFSFQIMIAFFILISMIIVLLRLIYHEQNMFNLNSFEFIQNWLRIPYLEKELSENLSCILLKTLIFFYFLFCCLSLITKKPIDQRLPLRENELIEENKTKILKCKKEEIIKSINLFCLIIFIIMFICLILPKFTLFVPSEESCNLNEWKEENIVLLHKKCQMSLLGELYTLIVQRKEIKIVVFGLNIMFIAYSSLNLIKGFIKKEDKKVD